MVSDVTYIHWNKPNHYYFWHIFLQLFSPNYSTKTKIRGLKCSHVQSLTKAPQQFGQSEGPNDSLHTSTPILRYCPCAVCGSWGGGNDVTFVAIVTSTSSDKTEHDGYMLDESLNSDVPPILQGALWIFTTFLKFGLNWQTELMYWNFRNRIETVDGYVIGRRRKISVKYFNQYSSTGTTYHRCI